MSWACIKSAPRARLALWWLAMGLITTVPMLVSLIRS